MDINFCNPTLEHFIAQETVTGFAMDSRLVQSGNIFFALPGEKVDGHQFLKEVAAKGAIGAVVTHEYRLCDFGLQLFRVKNVRDTLQSLAKKMFSSRKEKIIGVTGSMGKTTTKEFIATLLGSKYRVGKTPRSYNSQVSLPLTLLNLMKSSYDFLVLEMAMSQKGEIEKLVHIAPPHIALITNIAPASMSSFYNGLRGVASAKAEIFSHPNTKIGIVSAKAAKYDQILSRGNMEKIIYGPGGDFCLEKAGKSFHILEKGRGRSPPFTLSFQASHLLENFLGAATLAKVMGLSWDEIAHRCRELKACPMRFEEFERDKITFIQDCYNSNPDSLAAAFENLPSVSGEKIGILGTMPDLGKFSKMYHTKMGEYASQFLDRIFCIGIEMELFAEAFKKKGGQALLFTEKNSLRAHLFSFIKPGDLVLIKGANQLKLWEILET